MAKCTIGAKVSHDVKLNFAKLARMTDLTISEYIEILVSQELEKNNLLPSPAKPPLTVNNHRTLSFPTVNHQSNSLIKDLVNRRLQPITTSKEYADFQEVEAEKSSDKSNNSAELAQCIKMLKIELGVA